MDKFINSMIGARGNLEGHVTLAETDYEAMLENYKTPSDYQTAGKSSISSDSMNYNNMAFEWSYLDFVVERPQYLNCSRWQTLDCFLGG